MRLRAHTPRRSRCFEPPSLCAAPCSVVDADEALRGLRLAYTLIPITGTLLAIYVMRNYEIDEEEANRIRLEISKSK